MSRKMVLSVIVPVYNGEKYIEDCLKSIMSQQSSSFEVVLINDGSADHTAEICRQWTDRYDNILYLEQVNQGQGTARNVAITYASGEWLMFLDADDILLPGALSYLEKNITDEYDMLVYGSIFVSKAQTFSWRQIPPDAADRIRIMKESVSVLWDKVIRKDFWKRENIWLSNVYGEDVCPVYLLEARSAGIGALQIPLMCHYDRPDNLSSKPHRILQITQTLADTIETFTKQQLFETYKEPLFFLLLNHHKHYFRLWRYRRRQEEKWIMNEIEQLAVRYFPEEYLKLFDAEKESIVMIGKIERPFPAEIEARDVYYYPCLEHYILDENKTSDAACHCIINVENELRSVTGRTRTLEWALKYWEMQCMELLELRRDRKLTGHIFLYRPETNRDERLDCFEEAAEKVLKCRHLESLEDLWKLVVKADNGTMADNEGALQPFLVQNFNYRGEYLRLEYHVNLLCSWLKVRQQGMNLAAYFVKHGYERIAVYGIGYLGRLLLDELQGTEVKITYLIDQRSSGTEKYPLYAPDDLLPSVDVIVVSVVHQYDYIRMQLKSASQSVSLLDVVDWCAEKEAYREEG